ncbi:hypothetical protein HPP92_001255 [Vanilla planifolia]|uniref:Uncharacterized protein n=1 Tax=Vanilla planifolia TaxID=51239 RepID=A0A835RRD6_VANPL|nr:hypothetical protein HPP92_001255 [Vanilla planifolia]
MSGSRMRFFVPTKTKNERDEELALFRDLFKREREKTMNLLDAVSTEVEPIEGCSVLYKMSSGKKGDKNETEKQDYNWLKTPPATPLFQSLEIELAQANTNLAIQKELPIIPPIKPSRFSEKREEPKRMSISKPMVSQPVASSSRPETPHLDPLSPPRTFRTPFTTPITTPRFGRAQRFVKESDKGAASVKPQTRQFLSKKEEVSRLEIPDVNPKPPSTQRSTAVARWKADPNPTERTVKRTNKETLEVQKKLEPKLQPALVNTYPLPRLARDVPAALSLPETRNANPQPKPVERTAPPNLITTVAPGRATSATRLRPGAPAMTSAEQRRTPSVTKVRSTAAEATGEQGRRKRRGRREEQRVLIGSSMVEKMMNARRSIAAGKGF